jgi:16S rRNA (guanine527-N7)-methyltransferase
VIPAHISSSFPRVSRESLGRLELYVDLLVTWQKSINLIGPSTVDDIWRRHVADSLQLINHIPQNVMAIADLGSGGGLPGVVLACVGDWTVHLYESNQKKVAFLMEALRVTGARGKVHRLRLEEMAGARTLPQVQAVTARALAPLPKLLDYASPYLAQGATGYFHKGADVDSELTEALKSWKLNFQKHGSVTDSSAVILQVKEATRD